MFRNTWKTPLPTNIKDLSTQAPIPALPRTAMTTTDDLAWTVATIDFTEDFNDTWNASVNETKANNSSNFNAFYFYQTEELTLLWTIFAMIVVGNSAVLLALLLSKSKKSRMNFFIMQLAIADLLVGLISVFTDIVWKITVTWYAGNAACKVIRYLQAVVTYSSTYVLVALSIDRYDAITHPMNFSGCWKRAKLLVLMAWFVSALFSIPLLILYKEKTIDGNSQCWIEMEEGWKWQLYMTLVSITIFFIPTVIICACYAIIMHTIWNKGKILTPSNATSVSTGIGILSGAIRSRNEQQCLTHDGDTDSKRASSRGIIPKAKIKTVKMTIVIVLVFIMCWSPYIMFDLLQVFDHVPKTQAFIPIATFIQSLAHLNSAANPIIYCLFSTQICRNLRKIRLFDWLAEKVCLCCPALQTPLRQATLNRGSDFTTMSMSLSRSSRRSSNHLRNASLSHASVRHQPTSILRKHANNGREVGNAYRAAALPHRAVSIAANSFQSSAV